MSCCFCRLCYWCINSVYYIPEVLFLYHEVMITRSSPSMVFLLKGVLKICSKFTGEHPCRSAISIKSLCSFIEITLRHGCSRVNLLHIFETPFSKNTSRRLLLNFKKLVRLCNKLDKFQKLFSIGNEKLQ